MEVSTGVDLSEGEEQARSLKLNLGCGEKLWPGYDNLDDRKGVDVRKLPYEDGTVDEIQAIHLIEHLYYWDIQDTMKEWLRVLKPGGLLIIECPCFEKVLQFCVAPNVDNPYLTKFALYGGELESKDPRDTHKWCYSSQELADLLSSTGYVDLEREPALFHVTERDMRFLAKKPG